MSEATEEKPPSDSPAPIPEKMRLAAGMREAEPTVDILIDEAPPPGVTPFGEGKNLKALRAARDELLDGAITVEEYHAKVEEVHKIIQLSVDLWDVPAVQSALETVPPEDLEVIEEIKIHLGTLLVSIEQLMMFTQTEELQDIQEGMDRVEQEMRELTRLQSITAKRGLEEVAAAREATGQTEDGDHDPNPLV